MTGLILVGIGAGLASALLFAVVTTGSPLALILSSIAHLPVFIAALGWRHHAGLIALAAGTLVLALVAGPAIALAFAIGVALPAWWLGYLGLLGRGTGDPAIGAGFEWYPLGRLVLWAAIVAGVVTLSKALATAPDYESYLAATAGAWRQGFAVLTRRPAADFEELGRMLAPWTPAVTGNTLFLLLVANLWLSGRITRMSGRLPRPWPDIAALRLPREATAGLLGAAAGALVLPGFGAVACSGLLGALVTAFGLGGLAFIHERTRGRSWRTPVLGLLYVGLFLVLPVAAVLQAVLALLGFADSLFDLRRPRRSPSHPSS